MKATVQKQPPWIERKPAASAPLLSCIVCAYNEGETIACSLLSLAAQSFTDFEVLIVDDGANAATFNAINTVLKRLNDPRFRLLRQSNDGLSSARNRGMAHASGEYICFLDGDDVRPPWSFSRINDAIIESRPDVIFCRGMLSELRGETAAFYDSAVFREIAEKADGQTSFVEAGSKFRDILPLLMLVEPQSANKVVARSLIKKHQITFPNGSFFEDMLFHSSLISYMASVAIVDAPSFTYFRRYGHPQITSGFGDSRMDSVSVAKLTLESFAASSRFHIPRMRVALLLSGFRLLRWCHDSISHVFRYQFSEILIALIASTDQFYFDALDSFEGEYPAFSQEVAFIRDLQSKISARN